MRLRRPTPPGDTDFLSSAGSLVLPVGSLIRPGSAHGYYIDFDSKAPDPDWPPDWLGPRETQLHVEAIQWALGCHERFLRGEGERWLEGALAAGEHLIAEQGPDGGWPHLMGMPHTYRLEPPWLSAMAQGEAASLLVRLGLASGDQRFSDAARMALRPMDLPRDEGGLRADLDGAPWLEEYPTDPPSFVLNGAIFAIYGYYDAAVGLGDAEADRSFRDCVDALASRIDRFDNGYWSLYDLFPHPTANVASGFYHDLHINQLEALGMIAPRPHLEAALEGFRGYRRARSNRLRALAQKAVFRTLVPRNRLFANRWGPRPRAPREAPAREAAARSGRRPRGTTLVLCYHAISEDWPAPLSVTPERFAEQIDHLAARGYRGVGFGEAVHGRGAGKRVAVTFDDGYRSVRELALPILARISWPGTVFVVTDFVGAERPMRWPGIEQWLGTPYERELESLSWEELQSLLDAGWEVGSHTVSHPRLSGLDHAALDAELGESRRICGQRLGQPCRSIAYPYGDHDERVIAAARRAGYSAGGTLPARFHPAAPLRWPRVGVYHGDQLRDLRLKTSPMVRALRGSPLWAAINTIRGRHRDPSDQEVSS